MDWENPAPAVSAAARRAVGGLIIRGASLMRAGMIGIFACIACNVINYFVNKEDFIDLKGLGACCIDGAKQAASIAIPTAACGIIINVVTGQTSCHEPLQPHQRPGHQQPLPGTADRHGGLHDPGHGLPTVAASSGGCDPVRALHPAHSAGWRHGRLYLQPLREHVRVLLWHHGPDHAAGVRGVVYSGGYRGRQRHENRTEGLHLCHGGLPGSLLCLFTIPHPAGGHAGGDRHRHGAAGPGHLFPGRDGGGLLQRNMNKFERTLLFVAALCLDRTGDDQFDYRRGAGHCDFVLEHGTREENSGRRRQRMNERHQVAIAGMGLAALTTAARLTELGITEIALYANGFGGTPYIAAINFVLPDNPYGDTRNNTARI